MRNLFAAFSVISVLSGCGFVEKENFFPLGSEARTIAASAELSQRFFSNSTRVSHNNFRHGTQYEYHAPDGTTYLWYPGNRSIVMGQWKVERTRDGDNTLCYLYGSSSFNPVTRQYGGNWECRKITSLDVAGDETIKGDPFSLETGNIPFVMEGTSYYSPSEVMEFLGKSISEIDYITNIEEL
ncbi:hypothetical protein [Cochlodiniinecator piscidefendens]|uniref:hypothetical protein n=1 Tax=Cochlodiniinecator piscidefendens TaxID=2715756 RepID=UPI00140888ED|nr:hypothetical protein [Cochlodiniinecator piscidefendens]